jgi:aspartate dehydrogenase
MTEIRVAIAGLGSIGRVLARRLTEGMPGLRLVCVAAGDAAKAMAWLDAEQIAVPLVAPAAFPAHADLAVECAPPRILEQVCRPMLEVGKKVMVLSCGMLLERPDLIELARERGGQIIVPTGALIGLDAVTAAAEGEIKSVSMITRKPVKGLLGAPYLEKRGIDIAGITAPMRIFQGSAREAARGFPENVNVAAALALAGIGPDRTTIEIWADPSLSRNVHRIVVDSDSASFEMQIQNIPSENPKTGRITALSAIAALRKFRAPLRVGT